MTFLNSREQSIVDLATQAVTEYKLSKINSGPTVIPGEIGILDDSTKEPVDLFAVAKELFRRNVEMTNARFEIVDGKTKFVFKPLAQGADYTEDLLNGVMSRLRRTGPDDEKIIYHPKS